MQQKIFAKFHPDRATYERKAAKNLFSTHDRGRPMDRLVGMADNNEYIYFQFSAASWSHTDVTDDLKSAMDDDDFCFLAAAATRPL